MSRYDLIKKAIIIVQMDLERFALCEYPAVIVDAVRQTINEKNENDKIPITCWEDAQKDEFCFLNLFLDYHEDTCDWCDVLVSIWGNLKRRKPYIVEHADMIIRSQIEKIKQEHE